MTATTAPAQSVREAMLADLRQRAVWAAESASDYRKRDDAHGSTYYDGQVDGYRSAVFIIENYYPEAGS